MTTNEKQANASDMIELTGAALDAVAGGRQGADDAAPAPQAPEAPGDARRGK